MAGHNNNRLPKDAQVIISMLHEAGVAEYEPRVINQLLEFTYRYVTGILDEAKVYALHAKKKVIDLDDVKLASMMQLDRCFTTPPPRDILMEVAKGRNSLPLPIVKPHYGLRLPPDRHCLSACNYQLRSNKKSSSNKSMQMSSALRNTTTSMNRGGSMNVKVQGSVDRPGGMTVVSTLQPASQLRPKHMTVPKPVIKFSSPGLSSSGAALPKIQISAGPSVQLNSPNQNMGNGGDSDAGGGQKRKRESEENGFDEAD